MDLVVYADGYAHWKKKRLRCALGRSGITSCKIEGDGATPTGLFPFREIYFRADRIARPWCDDPRDALYNRHITLPIDASHEVLSRPDGLYDLVVVLGYNDDPVVAGKGSAIFLHVAAPDYSPTEGCVALSLDDLVAVVAGVGPDAVIDIRQGKTTDR
jgi:L,D-peptidoglycan transpeptidase YkuD (ErfK/YbiS/YcfS/YnhG family)